MEKSPLDEIPDGIRRKGEADTTVTSLRPGTICSLTYKNKQGTGRRVKNKPFTVLVVSNARSGLGSGLFSTAGDKFLSCFILDGLSFESVRTIKSSIDKYRLLISDRRKAKSYKYIANLFGLILGKNKYRTLSVSQGGISDVVRYDINFLSKAMS